LYIRRILGKRGEPVRLSVGMFLTVIALSVLLS
jgi:hypothetical protein